MNNLNVAKIQLNGDSYKINAGDSLEKLLISLKIQKSKVAVEVNGNIVERKKYENLILNNDDKVEIVQFIGGG
jgi:sulfur carrier protein